MLKAGPGRTYPTLRELLATKAPDANGRAGSFVASPEAYATVRELELANRVVPVVGDFGGTKALAAVAAEIAARKQTVRVFYVSNVEQYLYDAGVVPKWLANVRALPRDEASVFVRAFLDQGKPHPLQWKDHRTTNVVQKMSPLVDAKAPPASFFALATDATTLL